MNRLYISLLLKLSAQNSDLLLKGFDSFCLLKNNYLNRSASVISDGKYGGCHLIYDSAAFVCCFSIGFDLNQLLWDVHRTNSFCWNNWRINIRGLVWIFCTDFVVDVYSVSSPIRPMLTTSSNDVDCGLIPACRVFHAVSFGYL